MSIPAAVSAWLFRSSSGTVSPQIFAGPIANIIGSRTTSTSSKLYIDGTEVASTTGADSGSLSTSLVAFGAQGAAGPSANNFVSIMEQVAGFGGQTLSGSDVTTLISLTNTLLDGLGRPRP